MCPTQVLELSLSQDRSGSALPMLNLPGDDGDDPRPTFSLAAGADELSRMFPGNCIFFLTFICRLLHCVDCVALLAVASSTGAVS